MAILQKTDGALGLVPNPKLDIITDPLTKKQFFRDTSIPGSTYQAYTGQGTQSGAISPLPIVPQANIQAGQNVPIVPQPRTSEVDPLTKFNKMVFELLQGAKGGQLAQKSGLEELQSERALAPASELGTEGLAPGDAISARQRAAGQYQPAISNINDRIQSFNETLSFAKELGETYFKNIQPSEETIKAVQNQLRQGFVPSEDVLSKVGKFLTEDDWMAAAAAKKKGEAKPSSVQEYEYAKNQGYKGTYQQYQNEDANRKAKAAGLTSGQLQSSIDRVSDDFRLDPIVKQYTTAGPGWQFLSSINPNTKNPADNIGAIYAFAKIMDPESVVREGEYATVQKYAQAWAETFGFNAQRIFSNTNFLTSKAITNMQATARAKIQALQLAYDVIRPEYEKRMSDLRSGISAGGLPSYKFGDQNQTINPEIQQLKDAGYDDDQIQQILNAK